MNLILAECNLSFIKMTSLLGEFLCTISRMWDDMNVIVKTEVRKVNLVFPVGGGGSGDPCPPLAWLFVSGLLVFFHINFDVKLFLAPLYDAVHF